jgi:hypothetical protein
MNPLIQAFFSDPADLDTSVSSGAIFRYPYPETPHDFLEYAEQELTEDTPSKRANCLTHIEHALASQLDYFFYAYGLTDYAVRNQWGNGKKLALLGDLGLIPNRILHKVNEARNNLEHRYEIPGKETVINSIDIVSIFVSILDLFLFPAREEIEFYTKSSPNNKGLDKFIGKSNNSLLLCFTKRQGEIGAKGKIGGIEIEETVPVNESPEDFFLLLTYFLNYHRLALRNPDKYFRKLKYVVKIMDNDGITGRSK